MMRLTETEIDKELKNLSGWSVVNEKLHKDFQFDSFNQAFGFMTRAAMEIEKMNHQFQFLIISSYYFVSFTRLKD